MSLSMPCASPVRFTALVATSLLALAACAHDPSAAPDPKQLRGTDPMLQTKGEPLATSGLEALPDKWTLDAGLLSAELFFSDTDTLSTLQAFRFRLGPDSAPAKTFEMGFDSFQFADEQTPEFVVRLTGPASTPPNPRRDGVHITAKAQTSFHHILCDSPPPSSESDFKETTVIRIAPRQVPPSNTTLDVDTWSELEASAQTGAPTHVKILINAKTTCEDSSAPSLFLHRIYELEPGTAKKPEPLNQSATTLSAATSRSTTGHPFVLWQSWHNGFIRTDPRVMRSSSETALEAMQREEKSAYGTLIDFEWGENSFKAIALKQPKDSNPTPFTVRAHVSEEELKFELRAQFATSQTKSLELAPGDASRLTCLTKEQQTQANLPYKIASQNLDLLGLQDENELRDRCILWTSSSGTFSQLFGPIADAPPPPHRFSSPSNGSSQTATVKEFSPFHYDPESDQEPTIGSDMPTAIILAVYERSSDSSPWELIPAANLKTGLRAQPSQRFAVTVDVIVVSSPHEPTQQFRASLLELNGSTMKSAYLELYQL